MEDKIFFRKLSVDKKGEAKLETTALDHKCPSCGASLPFNPQSQKWDCEYCGASYSLVQLVEQEEKAKKEQKRLEDLDCYHCPDCGAEIVADKTTTATFCVYCGNTSILKEKLKNEFKPAQIIPFHTTKEQAMEAFRKVKKGKIFAPKDFNREENIQKITGVYIPFWIYDCLTEGNVDVDARRIQTWMTGNYRYTKTDYYRVQRSGNMQYDNVPVDGSSKFDDDMMDSIEPFDYKDLKEFNMSYLSGFLAENYDVSQEEAAKRMRKRVEKTTLEELKSTIRGYTTTSTKSENVNIEIKETEYILLPVWMLNIRFKNELYLFAMNGQTGKMIGNIPIDKGKLACIWLMSFLILMGLFSLIILGFRLLR